ncbi:LysR substrate-binding domain-containing protein [Nakamurella lactea]
MLVQLDSLGTVRAVADALHLSPSAVSSALAALEAETGTRLLNRVGRRVELTPAGRGLVGHGRAILDRMTTAVAELRTSATEPAGSVRLAGFSSALRSIAIPALTELRRVHPDIDVELIELDPQDSLAALRRDGCDIVITADFVDAPPLVDPEIIVQHLISDQIVFVTAAPNGSADAPAAADRRAVNLAEWSDRPWSIDMPGSYLATLINTLCRRAGFEPTIAGRFTSYQLQLEHVEAGLSVTLLPSLAIDPRYRVRALQLRDPATRTIRLAVRATATTAARDAVVRLLLRGAAVGTPIYGGQASANGA